MCGIAGGFHLNADQLDRMLAALHHRGPDGEGKFSKGSFRCGMRRLSILDLEQGKQPFLSSNGYVSAIFNGEIYNWQVIRNDLENLGHRFHTRCDGEILPAAWQEWGTDLPTHLNGMFTLAIHDSHNDTLFIARDRCGQKPLYYSFSKKFIFASEIKALAAAGCPLDPDSTKLSAWLSLRYLPEPTTLFKDIFTLPAAHWILIDSGGNLTQNRYWQPGRSENSLFNPKQESGINFLDHTVRSSVELALQSDVPLSLYLSGGVDSALLASLVKIYDVSVTTVSIGFGAESDETNAAIATAKHLSLPHFPTTLTPSSLFDLPRVIHQMERPIGDGLILAFDKLASHTAGLGCKVALGGEGPDEHFKGYSFQSAYLSANKLGFVGRKIASLAIQHIPKNILDGMAQFPASLGEEGQCKVANYLKEFDQLSFYQRATDLHTLFSRKQITELIHPSRIVNQASHPLFQTHEKGDLLYSLLSLQYEHWLPDWSLIRQDKNTMAHSIEYRSPFLDHRIIDFALGHPRHSEISRKDKYLWRQLAARYLPKSITQRPKQPFYLPLEHPSWRKPFIELARQIITPQSIARHSWLNFSSIEPLFNSQSFIPLKQLAAIMILQLWLDSHV